MSNLGNVVGGHKANLANPNTSEESKANSKQVLEGELADVKTGTGVDDGEKNLNRVAGGLKATINNPNLGEESKQAAQQKLDNL